MWRPKNWGRRVGGIIKSREPVFASDRLRENRFMVEAGADAMLEALRAVHSLEGFEKMVEAILKPEEK